MRLLADAASPRLSFPSTNRLPRGPIGSHAIGLVALATIGLNSGTVACSGSQPGVSNLLLVADRPCCAQLTATQRYLMTVSGAGTDAGSHPHRGGPIGLPIARVPGHLGGELEAGGISSAWRGYGDVGLNRSARHAQPFTHLLVTPSQTDRQIARCACAATSRRWIVMRHPVT
jgi:hypothetical protein